MITSNSASVAGPIFSASYMRRAGVHSAWRRCALGICSGIVVCRLRTAEKAWLATRAPRWKISTVALVIRASTTSRMSREGRDDRSVLYHRVPRLFDALALARGDGRHARLLKTLSRVDLLILDDWGLAPVTLDQARDLLEIVDDRHGRGSTIVTTQ